MSMKENAIKYFKSGYSCSESIVKAASEAGLCSAELLPIATSFSGGMSSGCVCRILSAGLEGMARKEHCSKYVSDVCEILEGIMSIHA